MKQEYMKFNLKLQFKDESIYQFNNIKNEEILQSIKNICSTFSLSEGLISQYIEKMKQQKINETIQFFVPDMKFKVENWFKLFSTRIE